ncbi:MAG: condensin subunit MukF [Myxococcota bacterium]
MATAETEEARRDLPRMLAELSQVEAALEVKPVDLGFLVALRFHGEAHGTSSVEEETLREVFEGVSEVYNPGAPLPQKAAAHAIERLRQQRLLARVDGARLVRAGAYALTGLARGIVDFFIEDGALTRESLELLLSSLRATLTAASQAARKGSDEAFWDREVSERLRVVVADLIDAIDRRQRGLDAQQADIREEVASMLEREWFEAIDRCEALLDETARTLRELNGVLVVEVEAIEGQLQDIEELARAAGVASVEVAVREVTDQLTRIAHWGEARMEAWSAYFQFVQRYIRSVVRLDRDRAFSRRLRELIRQFPEREWRIPIAQMPAFRGLREPERRRIEEPVRWRRGERSRPKDVPPSEPDFDEDAWARDLLAERGAVRLSEALEEALPKLAEAQRFAAVGRIAHALATHGAVRPVTDGWTAVEGGLEVQDWIIEAREAT